MKPEFYIARRFAFKQRSASKPTFIVMVAVIGIAVGTAALILTLSIVKGFAGSVENKLISFSDHLQIRSMYWLFAGTPGCSFFVTFCRHKKVPKKS